jgi:hypothetical protein
MALRIPEIDSAAIALVGSFNPSIFQPQWFARQGLLPPAEADAAEIKVLVPQICHFETERFIVQVTNDRFAASSKANTSSPPLRDLVIGTFFVLEHTPVTAIGLNREMHIPTESEEQWHRLGDRLVPKEGWQGILEGRIGMLSLDVTTDKTGQPGAKVNVKVQPSVRVKFGAYFLINEHYPAPEEKPLAGAMSVLRDRWEGAQLYAAQIASHILDWAKG